ncbi:MAG: FprA family A-type flavoprotein [candidate division Zixibacteria bacterium]|nr:FprA family A-type flavoprotein [candidate division Zixibacteria bacterium]
MSTVKLAENVYSVGVKDPKLEIFDIIMPTKNGTTYNAYLVVGEEKTALIDTVKKPFLDEFFANIAEIMPPEKIDYLVVNHNEPDHSGGVQAMLDKNPNLKIICGAPAMPFLKNIINREADIEGVKDGHLLDLGGKTLTFKGMPYMHWPDTMMEFLAEDGILFSNDGFATHLSSDTIWADEITGVLEDEFYYYWDVIMRPWAGFARKNLEKLDDFDIRMIAPSHGPVFRRNARARIDKYKEWAADKSEGQNNVALFYVSNYGNTTVLAETLAAELTAKGFTCTPTNLIGCKAEHARVMIESSNAIVIGTPTFNGDSVKPVWDLVNLFATVDRMGKKAAVFGSYGWGGEGIKLVAERLAGLKLKVYEENYRARLVPSDDELSELRDYAGKLAEFFAAGKKK